MTYDLLSPNNQNNQSFSKFIFGTVHYPVVDALSYKVPVNDYTVILLYSGLIDFVYQAAKSITEAMSPRYQEGSQSRVIVHFDLDSIKSILCADSQPVERLYRTLEAYLFNGYPRAFAFENIPQEHFPTLGIIVSMAERWIIGHEYGHGFIDDSIEIPKEYSYSSEYFSDNSATIATVYSGAKLDGVSPEFSLGGAIFAALCIDIIHEALTLFKNEEESHYDNDFSARNRASNVISCFEQYFMYNHNFYGDFDLSFEIKDKVSLDQHLSEEEIDHCYAYANILFAIWQPVKLRLLEDRKNKRPLYSKWN
jgi:hypothetical protein